MLSVLYAIVRPSVSPSRGWMKFSQKDSPIPLVFADLVSSRNCNRYPKQGHQTREEWEKQAIFSQPY